MTWRLMGFMAGRHYPLRAIGWLILVLAASTMSGLASANDVAASGANRLYLPVTANDLKPPECASLDLSAIVTGSGTFDGTSANDLVLGSTVSDTIDGGDGDDCILGGEGDDRISGGSDQGNDVLIGGAGDDRLDGKNGIGDVCHGGSGSDKFSNCEIIYDP